MQGPRSQEGRGAMAIERQHDDVTTSAALQEWRSAERAVAVAQRGKAAAEIAAAAAAQAVEAATATADAAKISAPTADHA